MLAQTREAGLQRGMSWWPAGHRACQTDTGGYALSKWTHGGTHTNFQTGVIQVKGRVGVTAKGLKTLRVSQHTESCREDF